MSNEQRPRDCVIGALLIAAALLVLAAWLSTATLGAS